MLYLWFKLKGNCLNFRILESMKNSYKSLECVIQKVFYSFGNAQDIYR
eukprot:UN20314